MKISIAQTRSIKGNISANIEIHKKLIALALTHNVEAIFFPELSLTNYEPKLAKALATTQEDRRFDDIQEITNKNKITIALGVPINTYLGIEISMIVFQPNKPRKTYSKQQLHSDELSYFVKGHEQIILEIEDRKIAPSICYESLQMNHSENASRLGADIYVASVAKSQKGIDEAMTHYPWVAMKFSMPVLMSNCVGYCDDFESVGQSSVWTKQGNLVGQLDNKREGILIFDTLREEAIEQLL